MSRFSPLKSALAALAATTSLAGGGCAGPALDGRAGLDIYNPGDVYRPQNQRITTPLCNWITRQFDKECQRLDRMPSPTAYAYAEKSYSAEGDYQGGDYTLPELLQLDPALVDEISEMKFGMPYAALTLKHQKDVVHRAVADSAKQVAMDPDYDQADKPNLAWAVCRADAIIDAYPAPARNRCGPSPRPRYSYSYGHGHR